MSNISRSKDNQAMKFGQLIQYNMWNVFLEKLCTKGGGETSPRLFSEKLKMSISLDQCLKFDTVYFYYIWQVEGYRNITKLSCKPLAFTSC